MGNKVNILPINEDSKVLVINTAFLGDVCLTSYLTSTLKSDYNCDITLLTTPIASEMMKIFESIDNILVFDKRKTHKKLSDLNNFADSISSLGFTHILSLHKSARTSRLVKQVDAEIKLGFNTSELATVYDIKVPYKFHLHEAKRYLEFLRPFGNTKQLSDINIQLTLDKDESNYVENLLISHGYNQNKPIITLAPGSVWETKKWGNKKFLNLANKLKDEFNIVLVGSKADKIQNLSENGIIDLIGETSIRDLFHIINKSIAVITNDSAPTHVASVLNKPVVTIYGPTDPIFGFYPLSKKSVSIKNYSLKCSPCDIHGQDRCPLGTHTCMKSINTNLVIDELLKLNITSTS